MSPRQHPPTKSAPHTPTGLPTADHTAPRTAVGDPKSVAEGVHAACRPNPPRGDGRHPVAWLHATAPGYGTTPTATSRCACGRDRSAVGRHRVLALITDHTAHRDACPLRTAQEGRNAA
ncbi:hypothetical protein ACX6XY_17745 [Streptomyces sp. O3]